MAVRRDPDTLDGTSPRTAVIAVITLASFVAVAVLLATASGLGVSPDGVAYLSLADEFRTSGSPYALLAPSPTHYAPLWSVLVGGIAAVTGVDDLLGIGRFLNALVAALVVPLVYVAARRSAAVPAWWAGVAAAVAALGFGLFRLSVRALTEPLFVVLILATLLLIEMAAQHRSRRLLLAAAAAAAAVILARFAGLAMLLPLAVAVWRMAPGGLRRVIDVPTVAVITVAPLGLWVLAAPAATASTHLGNGGRGGLGEFAASLVEAGHVLVDPPSAGFAEPLYLLLGAVALAAPFIGAAAVAVRRSENPGDHSRLGHLEASGLLPWLLFLFSYSALVSVQRWWIDREVIDRYWVPYIVVGVVVVARAVAESGLLRGGRSRRVVVATAAVLVVVNLALVVAFTATRLSRGIELNEARYQDSELFATVADADVDLVLTDSVRLVELHLVALGGTDIDVRDVGCRFSGESNAVAMATATAVPTAVILAGVCDREATTSALAAIAGAEVLTEADVGTLVLIDGP